MATKAQWTVVFDDKLVIKNIAEGAEQGVGYKINDDSFWANASFQNIWAIQYGNLNPSDTVEYRDETTHSTWEDSSLGDFTVFTNKWDEAHLAQLQLNWDQSTIPDETEADKIARLGPRPTSYSS